MAIDPLFVRCNVDRRLGPDNPFRFGACAARIARGGFCVEGPEGRRGPGVNGKAAADERRSAATCTTAPFLGSNQGPKAMNPRPNHRAHDKARGEIAGKRRLKVWSRANSPRSFSVPARSAAWSHPAMVVAMAMPTAPSTTNRRSASLTLAAMPMPA